MNLRISNRRYIKKGDLLAVLPVEDNLYIIIRGGSWIRYFLLLDPQVETEAELSMAVEYDWDFEKLEFKFRDGKMYLVEGVDAVRIWIWKLFMTTRYREVIFNWDWQ